MQCSQRTCRAGDQFDDYRETEKNTRVIWSRAKQAANSCRSCQTSGRQGFYQVLAKGGFHLVVIADGRGDQIEFENSFHMGIPITPPNILRDGLRYQP